MIEIVFLFLSYRVTLRWNIILSKGRKQYYWSLHFSRNLGIWRSNLGWSTWLECRIYLFSLRIRPGVYTGRRFINNVATLREKKTWMLSEFNSFERVKRRTLEYSVNGVSRRMSLANNSPFRKSYFSLSIKAFAHCKLQCEYYCWNHIAVTRNTCRRILRCQWNTGGTKALLKVLKNQYKILPQGMSVYPPKTYWSFCTMVTVLFLPSHLSWKVLAPQPCEVAL